MDSLHVINKIEVGNSVVITGINDHIYTNDYAALNIQNLSGYNQNTIINANNLGRVGIGTNAPGINMKLEILGSVSIYDGAPGNGNNGDNSLFFGREQHNGTLSYGEWGIQYMAPNIINNPAGGLNFWKPFGSDGTTGNNFLFLADNGNVGIGTAAPDASSLLDVYSSNQGVLIPNVALTASNVAMVLHHIMWYRVIIIMPEQALLQTGLVLLQTPPPVTEHGCLLAIQLAQQAIGWELLIITMLSFKDIISGQGYLMKIVQIQGVILHGA
ncbi:MAG: hypothetical protein ABR968_00685 [Bacteroidales bacterium]